MKDLDWRHWGKSKTLHLGGLLFDANFYCIALITGAPSIPETQYSVVKATNSENISSLCCPGPGQPPFARLHIVMPKGQPHCASGVCRSRIMFSETCSGMRGSKRQTETLQNLITMARRQNGKQPCPLGHQTQRPTLGLVGFANLPHRIEGQPPF